MTRFLAVLSLAGALAIGAFAGPGRSAPPAAPAVPPPSDAIIQAALKAKPAEEVDAAYPLLRGAAISWAQDWRAYMASSQPASPVISKMTFLNIVSCKDFPDFTKYLNYWARTRFAARTTGLHYVHNAFEKVFAVPPPRQAYALYTDEGRYYVLRFLFRPEPHPTTQASQPATQPGKAPPGMWDFIDKCEVVGAVRLGAAIGLMQEMFEAARDGKGIDSFSAGGKLAWAAPKPALWVVYEQKYRKGALGFFDLEDKLADDAKTSVTFGWMWRDEAKAEHGLNITLTRKPSLQGYLGWRIEKMEPADAPQTEPVK